MTYELTVDWQGQAKGTRFTVEKMSPAGIRFIKDSSRQTVWGWIPPEYFVEVPDGK